MGEMIIGQDESNKLMEEISGCDYMAVESNNG